MRLSLKELSTNTKLYLADGVRNLTFSPLQSGQWTIGELQPYTNYSLTLTAINSLGESPCSEALLFQTEEEGLLLEQKNYLIDNLSDIHLQLKIMISNSRHY